MLHSLPFVKPSAGLSSPPRPSPIRSNGRCSALPFRRAAAWACLSSADFPAFPAAGHGRCVRCCSSPASTTVWSHGPDPAPHPIADLGIVSRPAGVFTLPTVRVTSVSHGRPLLHVPIGCPPPGRDPVLIFGSNACSTTRPRGCEMGTPLRCLYVTWALRQLASNIERCRVRPVG